MILKHSDYVFGSFRSYIIQIKQIAVEMILDPQKEEGEPNKFICLFAKSCKIHFLTCAKLISFTFRMSSKRLFGPADGLIHTNATAKYVADLFCHLKGI